MKLEKLASVAEIVSGIAIVVTLIVLILETRANTAAIRAAAFQGVADSLAEGLQPLYLDADIYRIWSAAFRGDELSESDRGRFGAMVNATLRTFENAFYQYQLGTIEPAQWESIAVRIQGLTVSPATRDWWSQNRDAFSPEFRSFVEQESGGRN